jgi:selenocysteine-specific translation elongation factor
MKGLTVAVLGDAEFAAELGKKGTVSDVSFFNLKQGQDSVTYVVPSRYPEKLQSMATALGMADAAVFVVEKLDKELGETIVAIDSFGIRRGFIILKNYISADQLRPFVVGTTLEEFRFHERDAQALNRSVLELELPPIDGPVKVPIDHFFDVKGVGTVALGCVKRGVVRQHDSLEAFPTGKKAMVRSIQVHDEDVKEAPLGARVGLALKGIEVSDLDRGVVFAPAGSLKVPERLALDFAVSKYWKGLVKNEMVLHAACGLQIVPARVESLDSESLRPGTTGKIGLRFEKPLACEPGDRIIGFDLDSKGLRIAGYGICP